MQDFRVEIDGVRLEVCAYRLPPLTANVAFMGLQRHPNSSNWYYCFQIKGKRYYGSTGTQSKTVALQVEKEVRAKAHASVHLSVTEEISLHDALIRYCSARRGHRSESGMTSLSRKVLGSTYDNRRHQAMTCHGLDGKMRIHELTTRLIEGLVAERRSEGNSEHTIKHEVGILRATCNEMRRLPALQSDLLGRVQLG